jgi:hypothetical protein
MRHSLYEGDNGSALKLQTRFRLLSTVDLELILSSFFTFKIHLE